MAVYIMQMNDIGSDFFKLTDDLSCRSDGIEAVIAPDPGFQSLGFNINIVRTRYAQLITVAPAAVNNIVLYIIRSQQLADPNANLSCAADAAG